MYKRIVVPLVVPLDGSEIADTALEHAKSFAKLHQIPIKIVRAVDPPLVDQVTVIGMRPGFSQVEGVVIKGGMMRPTLWISTSSD
ncbi:MAG: universal stress protein [Thermomicrobiales bacterium]